MKVARVLVKVLLLAGLLAPVVVFATAKPEKQTITFEGQERVYYTFAPERAVAAPEKPAAPVPLLLLLSGPGRDGMSQIEQWQTLAEQEGLVLVAPSFDLPQRSPAENGTEFLHEIVEAVRGKYPIDSKRIYLFGQSAGALFALSTGMMESQYFAAAGVHASAMREEFYPSLDLPKRKLPLAIWVGTEDPHFSLTQARNTESELKKHGFNTELFEMKDNDRDSDAVAKDLNPKIWSFLSASSLETDAKWQTYRFTIDGSKKIRVSSGVAERLKIHDVQPVYPWDARVNHISGSVLLQATIDQQGNTANIVAVQGDPILVKSAIKAVSQWKYRPYIFNGKPVEVETTIKIQYHM